VNDARKQASQDSLDLLGEALDSRSESAPVAVAVHGKFHRGISGLIASKIAEKLMKPALVLVPDGECYRGSVRAFRNENVHGLIDALQEHLIQFGGHRQAAGFQSRTKKLKVLSTRFSRKPLSCSPQKKGQSLKVQSWSTRLEILIPLLKLKASICAPRCGTNFSRMRLMAS
jgi:single-stranded DNA-specific DHH superfamily exonuclease